MNRRYFLMSSAAAGAVNATRMVAASDKVRVGIVGVRGQGGSHIRAYSGMKNVEIVAICDIDESVRNKRIKEIESDKGKAPTGYVDIRKMLEDKTIDCVSIATPNHNHTLQTIWSLQAGKNVYVEKPCSHNIFESTQIVAAARKYNKLVQHGTNSRSTDGLREAVQKLREGVIGDVYMSRGLCFKWRNTIKKEEPSAVPAGVDYDLWLGPAPKRQFTKNRFHYNWHWFWDYGNGDYGNQGIHEVDICRWGLGVKVPTRVSAMGGKYMFDDDQETPNTMVATYEFQDNGRKQLLVFEVRHWMTNHEAGIGEGGKPRKGAPGNTVGNVFYGSKGYMAIDGYTKYATFLGVDAEPGPAKQAGGSNWGNFIDAVVAGKREMLNAEIQEGALSCSLMHYGNISYRLGRSLEIDPKTGMVKNDPQANAMFTRNYRTGFVVPKIA